MVCPLLRGQRRLLGCLGLFQETPIHHFVLGDLFGEFQLFFG
jgi:hypothetical protein